MKLILFIILVVGLIGLSHTAQPLLTLFYMVAPIALTLGFLLLYFIIEFFKDTFGKKPRQ